MSAITNTHPQITQWVLQGRLTSDQGMVLCDEARSKEQHYDPYGDMPERESEWDKHPWVERVYLVNEYEVYQAYGGPEEGGWWYEVLVPTEAILGVFDDQDDAYEVARHLNAFANAERRQIPSYVSDKGKAYMVESNVPREPSGPMRYC